MPAITPVIVQAQIAHQPGCILGAWSMRQIGRYGIGGFVERSKPVRRAVHERADFPGALDFDPRSDIDQNKPGRFRGFTARNQQADQATHRCADNDRRATQCRNNRADITRKRFDRIVAIS